MSFDSIFILGFFIGTILLVMASIEAGYRLGRVAHRRSAEEKESPVSAIAGTVLALLAFILAFTFGIAANRFDTRKELVRDEANKTRTAWLRSDFLPEPDRAEAKSLFYEYVRARIGAAESSDAERMRGALSQANRIQSRLWDMAVVNARKDMNSDVAALYIEALNEMSAVHASRVAVALQMRIPSGIWITLIALTVLGMMAIGYQAGIAGSERTAAMLLLSLAFASVIAIIGALDHPVGGLTNVSQQPLVDLLSLIEAASR